MAKQHFFLKLIPPRPSFPFDMNEEEKRLMGEHGAYLRRFFDAGKILAFGPVLAASGSFGMGLLEVEDEAEARRIVDADPTVVARLNAYELSPMRLVGPRNSQV
ncbi:MAG TPA: YciI family protein [Myxococcaceae bacterium]|nr:YciI family protein [Myxococcaceae bacterium]